MKAKALGPDGIQTFEIEWTPSGPLFKPSSGSSDHLLIPGFVDIHIHGAFGLDFMSASREDLHRLCSLLEEQGYEGFLPTTVTATADDVSRALGNLPDHPMILGVHLEGPFISPKHPGAQPVEHIASPTGKPSPWDQILHDPRLKVITIAPEIEGALPLIQSLSQRGVIVSMGHSDATYSQAEKAVQSGARHATHTFNAMRGFHHREVGLAGFVLSDDRVGAELIYDRLHVSREAAALLIRNKPADRLIAVSDSSMATGMAAGQSISMWGHECVVKPGEVRLASNGALAGSAITLLDAFRNLCQDFGAETAIRACCLNPRLALGLSTIKVWLELDANLQILKRWTAGGPS